MPRIARIVAAGYPHHITQRGNYQQKIFSDDTPKQNLFFSCVLDEQHMIACARYIERNPVRANLVEKPCLWAYSSVKIHCGINTYDSLRVNRIFDYIKQKPKTWKEWINEPDDFEGMRGIREKTRTGRPLGANDFVEKLEGQLKRFFNLKPKERPKKKVDK